METELQPAHQGNDVDEKYVFPWMGIVANLPIEWDGKRYVGKSGSGLRDDLTNKGFNPVRVHPLWNHRGHSGYAVVEFSNNWDGFAYAIKLEKSFESQHRGKLEYLGSANRENKLYGWVAKADDFKSSGVIGDYLRKNGDLKSISEIQAEDKRKNDALVSNLAETIEAKSRRLKEIESKCNETSMCLSKVMMQRDEMIQEYNEGTYILLTDLAFFVTLLTYNKYLLLTTELQGMAKNARDQLAKMIKEREKNKSYLEAQRKELELREKELVEREALNDNQRQELHSLKQMNERAEMEQKRMDESVLKLAEEQKKEKETLRDKILELQTKLDSKQALELEIERLKGATQVMRHMGDGQDVKKKLDEIQESLKEKEEELEDLEALNQALVVKERRANVELQDARKELIDGMKQHSSRALIGVKRMGELDIKRFQEITKKMFVEDADLKAAELCSIWEAHLRDPKWHPFKVVTTENGPKVIHCSFLSKKEIHCGCQT
ncbi:PREDICTED: factor of DNA methylation 4-like [Nicotiana attenuata]|uniref:factor of DNA methylation 4-like n=1 Tax=Nicotiana attenuata TaxID=49451 RepID=UPI0009052164|nr:PREDICTED: factor of DNA methylation 4-like [Nicotiana attenuata]